MNISRNIARALLDIGAVLLRPDEPFVWTSGLKSPIYCDNRLTLSYPHVRRMIADGFVAAIRESFADADVVAGVATGGIAHAALVADRLDLPMVYVRDKAKGHGRQNVIEGALFSGQRVVVIEDLVSTGGSSLKAVEAVRGAGARVLGVVAVFTYGFEAAARAFAEAGVPLRALCDYPTLIEVAREENRISLGQLEALRAWRENPEAYGGNSRINKPGSA